MDPYRLLFISVCIGLSGAQDVTTVSRISVLRGQSVIIPCLYKQKYASSHKYFSSALFSDQRYHQHTVSISDDQSQNIFTVRMEDVQESGLFWCGIQIPSGQDKRAEFMLDVTAGPAGLSVSRQSVWGSENGSVSVTCHHEHPSAVRWCRVGGACVSGASGTLDGAQVQIRSAVGHVTVSVSELKQESAGWYCCSTDLLQMPVHISVGQNHSLATPGPGHGPPNAHRRASTTVLFLLPVVVEILILLSAVSFCRDRLLRREGPAEPYVTMHGTESADGAAADGGYESIADLRAEPQTDLDYVNVTDL